MAMTQAATADPAWWSAPDTKIWDGTPQNVQNWSPANVGQLKHVATKAKRFLDTILAAGGGAGPEVNAVCQFTSGGDYAPVNVGQLKSVAQPFYDRLAQIHYNWQTGTEGVASSPYPWTGTTDPENGMPANLGQLKNVFSFEPGPTFLGGDADGDQMPSWWEVQYGLNPLSPADAGANSDGDALTNIAEFINGFNPIFTDTILSYGSLGADFVAVQAGAPRALTSFESVSYAILAYDQTLRYGRDRSDGTVPLVVRLKAGTPVTFFYAGSLPSSPGYASSGTLADLAAPQALAYGYHGDSNGWATKLYFKPGTSIVFRNSPSNSVACGYVRNGTVEGVQNVYCGQSNSLVGDTIIPVAAGSACVFTHFPTNGPAMSGYLESGVVNSDTVVPYSHVSTGSTPNPWPSVKIKGGTAAIFQHYKSNGFAAVGYLSKGTLAENSPLYFAPGAAQVISAASGTVAEFGFIPSGLAAYGFVDKCVPAVDKTVLYGTGASVTIMAGKRASFTRTGALSTSVGYLNYGTLALPGPVSLPYSFVPARYANFAAGQEVSFIRLPDNRGCVSSGFLQDNTGSQLIYPQSGSTTSQSVANGSFLAVNITSTNPPVTTAHVRNPVAADQDGDGFTDAEEAMMGTNPLVPDNFQRDGDLSTQPADVRDKTLVVVGDGDEGVAVSPPPLTVTIPPGNGAWLVVQAIKSEEFPRYTRDASQFDDSVKATVSGAISLAEPAIRVNSLHVNWLMACESGPEPADFLGFAPVYMKILGTVQADPTASKQVILKLEVTNIADGALPTTAILSVLPIEFEVKHGEIDLVTNQVVNPGADTILRDEIADIRIKIPAIASTDWTVNLSVEPETMRTQSLSTRGSVQMYDFGQIETSGVVTPGLTQFVLPGSRAGERTIKSVLNKEGKLKIKVKSPDGRIDFTSPEYTIKERIRKYAIPYPGFPNHDPNKYDQEFVDGAKYWGDFYGRPIDTIDRLKAISVAESNVGAFVQNRVLRPYDILTIGHPEDDVLETIQGNPQQWDLDLAHPKKPANDARYRKLNYLGANIGSTREAIKWGVLWLYVKAFAQAPPSGSGIPYTIKKNPAWNYDNRNQAPLTVIDGIEEPEWQFVEWHTWDNATKLYNGGGDVDNPIKIEHAFKKGQHYYNNVTSPLWPIRSNKSGRP